MDDSDQDFVDLCSKLLRRVRKKPGESRQPRKAERQPSSQASDGDKRRRNNRRDGDSGSQPVCTGAEERVLCGGTGHDSGDAESSSGVPSAAAGPRAERRLSAKDKVLHRMQQFKRVSPQRMVLKDKSQPTNHENDSAAAAAPPPPPPPPPPLTQGQDTPESFSSGLHPEPQDSDEALALRLQQELDREAAEAQTVDLEDGGLFFCQICQRDLSHMTPDGRTQHLNRCLDESEKTAPAPPPPPPGVPDCPICGKKFKSQKSRSAHLKRCSSEMGVAPAVLLQALQRQTEETQSVPTVNTVTQTGGTKRKGPSKPGLPAKKKPRKKTPPLDEETMVAMALSSSLLEQQQQSDRESEMLQTAASHISMTPALKWRPDAGKGRGKRKKGAVPRPPPLLLVQDAEVALARLQERVSALLLRSRAPSPPTPTRCPSSLPGWSGAAPLWQKSALLDGANTCLSDFYTPELREFFMPWEAVATDATTSSTVNKLESSFRPVSEGTPVTETRASILPSSTQTASSSQTALSTPGTGRALLMDLMELVEDGATLTQYGHTAPGPDTDKSVSQNANLRLSGFLLEESEEQADFCVSGFLPDTTHTHSDAACSRERRTTVQAGADKDGSGHRSVALSRLASDLSSMVNNPQLSDLQLQVDSGEVYFAHSFMVYARCPLLAEMVHESGFGVREEGMPATQRVLMNDVPGQAVFALLRYLYTARCAIPESLRPHMLELASRFDLQELQQLCELHQEDAAPPGDEEDYINQEENVNNQTDQALMVLLRSMWGEEDEDDEGTDTDGGRDKERDLEGDHHGDDLASGDGEISEEKVNEDELEEIYEFAATQRKREEEKDSMEEEEEERVDEEEDGVEVFTKLTEPRRSSAGFSIKKKSQLEPDPSLDRSYSRLFSESWGVYEEEEPSSSPSTSHSAKAHTSQSQQHQFPHKPLSELSGRTLLQSSASVAGDLSPSPPPSASNLPIPGQSPGEAGDWGGGGDEGTDALKRESQGPRSICVPFSPDSSQDKKEPEVIILSDSSEEMEVVLSSRSPSPNSPCVVQNLQSYTQIKPQPVLKPNEPTQKDKQSSSLEISPHDSAAAPAQSRLDDQDLLGCSPEVSWLIPSTPVQPVRSSTTSSTQTKSSMCRTQLFPRVDTSSHSSSAFSSPALPLNNRLQTSNSSTRASAYVAPTQGSVPKLKLDETSSASLDLNLPSKRTTSCDWSKDRGVLAAPPCQPKPSTMTSLQDTPLHAQLQPYSSTPLHTELHKAPVPFGTSPLHSNLDKQRSTSQGKPSESPEKTELGSFHLSHLSDPSEPPSSTSHRGLQSSQRHSGSSSQSRHSVESSSHNNTDELKSKGIRDEEGEVETECENKGEKEEAETGLAEAAESSLQQSFMDEPPIAFNDSWGFDACADVDANPGCFSLRLEDSGASSQQGERSLGQRETARSPSSVACRPSPSKHSVHLLNSHSSVTASKAHSTQPSSSEQAHSDLSFTPSPPNPTTRTPPEISNSLLDSKVWDSWEEEEEEEALPLSQRADPSVQIKTPVTSHNKRRRTLVPITPLPHYSDMDTPELKNKLNRFGVRPLPKRQMILKLKEIHQYTHQLVSSDSEDEAPSAGRTVRMKQPPTGSEAPGNRPVSCTQRVKFKEPRAPAAISPLKASREEEAELLSASQGSNTSSTAASEESERSNPELCLSSDSDSDGGISASQSANRLQDRLQAVRSFILSDSALYSQILQYQPLVLSQLQERLKAAGIRLGATKLADYLDSQCITFTTAKPGHSAPSRRRGRKTGKGAKVAGGSTAGRKKAITAMI
ncbi:structure-specific endonuclease subunit SLX4 [Epinephelus fuscoguttatus]|uniref:structure-specific endonuclease subunit SLX4 n=1 Tax=Epinephelus fuscoguttatus TaxID=293821 RepID=UPI0020D00D75|nr:structure-specific endonuclease subunit SLX4 [Epinephelus fuscoguttatus]